MQQGYQHLPLNLRRSLSFTLVLFLLCSGILLPLAWGLLPVQGHPYTDGSTAVATTAATMPIQLASLKSTNSLPSAITSMVNEGQSQSPTLIDTSTLFGFSWDRSFTVGEGNDTVQVVNFGITRADVTSAAQLFYKKGPDGLWTNFLTLRWDIFSNLDIASSSLSARIVLRDFTSGKNETIIDIDTKSFTDLINGMKDAASSAKQIVQWYLMQFSLLYLYEKYGHVLLDAIKTPFIEYFNRVSQVSPEIVPAFNALIAGAEPAAANALMMAARVTQSVEVIGVAAIIVLIATL